MATFTPLQISKGLIVQHTTKDGVEPNTDTIIGLYEALVSQDPTSGSFVAPSTPVWDVGTGTYVVGDGTKWKDAVAAYVTDNELIRAAETTITWPDAQSKLNYCICRFQNEAKDFKEDVVMWPDKAVRNSVYDTYLDEDGDVALETDISLVGITSYYTALAKAEYIVRSSRSKITYTFSVNRDYLYLEPGDIVKFQSDVLRIPGEINPSFSDQKRALRGDLVLILEVKPDNQGSIKITAERYDANVLAWNVKDNEVSPIRQIFKRDLAQAHSLTLIAGEGYNVTSAGILKWTNANDARVSEYRIKMAQPGIPSLATEWTDLGVATSGVRGFVLPMLSVGRYMFTVVAASATKTAPQVGWPILDTSTEAITSVDLVVDPIAFIQKKNTEGQYIVNKVRAEAVTEGFVNPTFEWRLNGDKLASNTYFSFRNGTYYNKAGGVIPTPSEGFIAADITYYALYDTALEQFKNANGQVLDLAFVQGPVIDLPPFESGAKECSVVATEQLFNVVDKTYETDTAVIYSFKEGDEGYMLLFSNSSVNLAAVTNGQEIIVTPAKQLDKLIETRIFAKGLEIKNLIQTDPSGVEEFLPLEDRVGKPHITYALECVDCLATISEKSGKIKIVSISEANASVLVKANIFLSGVNATTGLPISVAGKDITVQNILTVNALLPGNANRLARLAATQDMFVVKLDTGYSALPDLVLKDVSTGYISPQRVWSMSVPTVTPGGDESAALQAAEIATANSGYGSATLNIVAFSTEEAARTFSLRIFERNVTVPPGSTEEETSDLTYESSDSLTFYSIREGSSNLLLTLSDAVRVIPSDWLGTVKAPFDSFTIDAKVRRGAEELPNTLGIKYDVSDFGEGVIGAIIDENTGLANISIDPESTTVIGGITFAAVVPKAVAGTPADVNLFASFRYTKTMSSPPPDGPFTVDVGTQGNVLAFIKRSIDGVWTPPTIVAEAFVNRSSTPENPVLYEWSCSEAGAISISNLKTCSITRTWEGAATITVKATYTENGITTEVYDSTTIFALIEGSGVYSIALTNPTQMVRCDSAGTPIGALNLNAQAVVARGIDLLAAGITGDVRVVYSKGEESGCSGTVSSTGAANISSINADEGSLEVVCTISRVSDSVELGKVSIKLNFYKSYAGVSSSVIGIAQKGLVFKKDKDNLISPSSLALSLNLGSLTNTSFSWNTGADTAGITVQSSEYASVVSKTFTVTINGKLGGVAVTPIVDSITIPLIIDGDPSVTLNLGNDNVTFQAGPSGHPDSYVGSACTLSVYRGALELTPGTGANQYTFSLSASGIIATQGISSFTVSGMADDVNSATVEVTVTAKDGSGNLLPSVKKTATYSVSRSARASVKGVAFARTASESPETPIGGSFTSPTPAAGASGWSDGIPSGTLPLWMSIRLFTLDGKAPQDAVWSTPKKVSSLGKGVKAQFSLDGNPPWDDVANVDHQYMRIATSIDDGATWTYGAAVKIKGEKGNSAPAVSLTVSPYAFVKGKDGNTTPGTATFTANVVNLTPPLSYSWSGPSFTAGGGSLNNTATVDYSGLNATTRSKTVTCTVTGAGPVSASDTESVIYLIDGDDAIIGYLLNSNQTVTFDKDGNPTVNTLSATYTLYKGADALVLAPGAYSISPSGINTGYTATMSSGAVTISNITSSFPAGGVTFTVSAVYNGKTYSDKLTVSRVNDGAPLVAIDLDNDSATVSTDFQGNGGVLGGAAFTSNADIIRGGIVNNTGWTFTWSSGTLTPASASGRTYTCTGISVDSGSATVTATHATYGTRSAVFNVSKVKTGNPGTQYWIVPSHKVVSKNAAGIFTPLGNVTFTAMKKVGTAAPVAATEATLTPASAAASSAPITCSMKVGGVEVDTETIPLVIDGASGTNGAPGKATYTATVYLQNATYGVGNPPQTPSNSGSYNFYTGNLIAPSGWSVTQPDITTVPTWACDYTFTGTAPFSVITEPTVANGSWTNPRMDAIKSLDGRNTIVCEIYATGTRTTYPALPGTCTYNFQDHSCTGLGAYWGLSMPANPGTAVIWMSSVVFSSRENTATAGSWSNPVIVGNFISDEQQQGRTIDTFLYLVTPRADAPGQQPTIISPIDFDIGAFNWSAPDPWSYNYNFVAPSSTATAANSYWACRVYIKETYYKSTLTNANAFTATVSGPFRHINNEGLVTFTNMATARNKDGYYDTTMIDGGAITTDTIRVNSITSGSAAVKANLFFGFGITSAVGGWLGGVIGESYRADAIGGAFYSSANNGVGGIGINGGVFNTYPSLNKACGVSTQNYSIDAQAAIYAPHGVTPFTGRHEVCVEDMVYEIGDILVDTLCLQRVDVSNTVFICNVSNSSNQKNAIGVYSGDLESLPTSLYYRESDHFSKKIIIPCFAHLLNTHKGVFANALGEGQINICGEGGDLEAGDLIVTSSIPGKGMKQADDIVRSYTVARVREPVTFTSPTEVKMVSCIYLCG